MSALARVREAGLPATPPTYRWRTSEGLMVRPAIMATSHLHNTLVMIWHHSMPERARLRPYYRRYTFDPNFYTADYMLTSVRVMMAELVSRDDLKPWMERELLKMRDHLRPIAGKLERAPR